MMFGILLRWGRKEVPVSKRDKGKKSRDSAKKPKGDTAPVRIVEDPSGIQKLRKRKGV